MVSVTASPDPQRIELLGGGGQRVVRWVPNSHAHFLVAVPSATSEPVEVALPESANELIALLIQGLQQRGADVLEGMDVWVTAKRLLSSVPTAQESPWNALVGPFYDTPALNRWRGVSRQRHQVLRDTDRLLGLRTANGEILYPSFQFDDDGDLLPHLPEVLGILRESIDDEWTRALWLNTPVEVWGGRTAAQMLRGSAEDAIAVLRMAEDDVASRRQ